MTEAGQAQQAASLLLALLGGSLVGWVFFHGLRRTLQALPEARHPGLLIGISLLLRLALLLGAGWLLFRLGGELEHLLAAFVGVMLVRFLLLRRLGRGRNESEDSSP
jgi:F1F0 ATPase subunit 2